MGKTKKQIEKLLKKEKISHRRKRKIVRIVHGFRSLDEMEHIWKRRIKKTLLLLAGAYTIGNMFPSTQKKICNFLKLPENYFTKYCLMIWGPLSMVYTFMIKEGAAHLAGLFSGTAYSITDIIFLSFVLYAATVWIVRIFHLLITRRPSFSPTPGGIVSQAGYVTLKHYHIQINDFIARVWNKVMRR